MLLKSKVNSSVETEATVTNIVAVYNLNKKLNLNTIMLEFGDKNLEYNPDQFPAIVYRLTEFRTTVLIFSTGKCVITGSKLVENVIKTIQTLHRLFD